MRCEAPAETLPRRGHGRGVSPRHRPHMGGPLRATVLVPLCHHTHPLVPPHASPSLEASPRPRSHASEAQGLDVAHHRPLGTIPQADALATAPFSIMGGPVPRSQPRRLPCPGLPGGLGCGAALLISG